MTYELTQDRRDHAILPEISIAVATKNRSRLLVRLFQALERQTLDMKRFELIVADDGSTDDTTSVLAEMIERSPLRVAVVRSNTSGGPSVARNAAWRLGRGPLVAFTDDDCAPAPEWLERGLAAMEERVGILSGRTVPDPSLPSGPFSRTAWSNSATWMPTCNIFYRRSDVEAVGGFAEDFPFGGEDTDLAYRVRARFGREFVYLPDALVYHDIRPDRFLAAARDTIRQKGIALFFKRHPEARALIPGRVFWRPSHPRVLLATMGLAMLPASPLAITLSLPWLNHRLRVEVPGPRSKSYAWLPGAFALDLLEVLTMLRGSIRYKTVLL